MFFNEKVVNYSEFVNKILDKYNSNLNGLTIAVWGLAFKPKTNDMREAPSITIINELLNYGVNIKVFDPKAMSLAKTIFSDKIQYCSNAYSAIENADCLLLLTEWNEFRRPDFDKIIQLMKKPVIFDGRNQYDKERLISKGIEYYQIGR